MKVSISASALCLFSGLVSSLALPVAEPKDGAIEARNVIPPIHPSLIMRLVEDHPDMPYSSEYAEVSRTNGAHTITSLLAYTFTTGYPGKTCVFYFSNPTDATGSREVQLFTVGGPITTSNTPNSRPFRDQYFSDFIANAAGAIVSPPFACPTSATTLNFEVAPVGDNDHVTWSKTVDGLVIQVLGFGI